MNSRYRLVNSRLTKKVLLDAPVPTSYHSGVTATPAGPDDLVYRVISAVRPRLRDEVDLRILEDTARRVVIELSEGARVVDFVPVLAEHRLREELRYGT